MKTPKPKVGRKIVKICAHTGKPRRWICHNHKAIDACLQEIEMCVHYHNVAKREGKKTVESAWEELPADKLKRLTESLGARLYYMRKALLRACPAEFLSPLELKYCESEDIKPADYADKKFAE